MSDLIKQLNENSKEPDAFADAIKDVERQFNISLEEMEHTHLSDEQMRELVHYAHDDLLGGKPAPHHDVEDALRSALDDVAGFETAPEETIQDVMGRLVAIYNQEFGEG